jgi:hypothetical protein
MTRRFPSCDLVALPTRWATLPLGADGERRSATPAHGGRVAPLEPHPTWEDLLGRR